MSSSFGVYPIVGWSREIYQFQSVVFYLLLTSYSAFTSHLLTETGEEEVDVDYEGEDSEEEEPELEGEEGELEVEEEEVHIFGLLCLSYQPSWFGHPGSRCSHLLNFTPLCHGLTAGRG